MISDSGLAFSNPQSNIAYFGLKPGMRVADFGAGTGAYALPISRAVGSQGKVYALEVRQELTEKIAKEARESGAGNIEVLWANIEKLGGSKLADVSVDLVLIANVLFQTDKRELLAQEAVRILRPGGQVVVIDWADSFGGLGPSPERVLKPEQVKDIFSLAGIRFQSEFPAGAHHYGLIFLK